MAKSNREELLLQSFEVLKDDLDNNSSKIRQIIEKISKHNLDLAIDMWRYVLTNGDHIVKEDGYSYTDGMIYSLQKNVGEEKVIDILEDNEDILESVFGKSNSISEGAIWNALKFGKTNLAIKMYELVKKNRRKETPTSSIVESICEYFADEFEYIQDADEYDDYLSEEQQANEIASVLLDWVGKLNDKEAKARITVTLIDYI